MSLFVQESVAAFLLWGITHAFLTKATMNFCCFRAKLHTVDFMAADASGIYLATGCEADIWIWKGDKHCMSLAAAFCALFTMHIRQVERTWALECPKDICRPLQR